MVVKTLRLHLPVLDVADEEDYLDLVTRVPGVVAAIVDETTATLDVVVSSDACALLVQHDVRAALLSGAAAPA